MREQCWKRCLITNRISRGHQSTELSASHSDGEPASTGHSSRRFRSRSWRLPSISATSSCMPLCTGSKVAIYPVSTSMFGLGDAWGRMTTPVGYLAVEKKIGDNVPVGGVFHNRRLTGEVLQPNAPGRDPITTRIIWLRGLETQNAHAFQRCIYIHGTPEEKKIGRPASYGCIRMKSKDVAELYAQVPVGAVVQITPDRLPKMEKGKPRQEMSGGVVAANTTPLLPPQITATAAKVTPEPPHQI